MHFNTSDQQISPLSGTMQTPSEVIFYNEYEIYISVELRTQDVSYDNVYCLDFDRRNTIRM